MLRAIVVVEWVVLMALGIAAWQRCEPHAPTPAAGGAANAVPGAPVGVEPAREGGAEGGNGGGDGRGLAGGVARVRDAGATTVAGADGNVILSGRLTGVDLPLDLAASPRLTLRRGDTWRSAEFSAGGAYAVTGLAPGEWDVTCQLDGYRKVQMAHALDEREFQSLDLTLEPAAALRVFVQTPEGARLQAKLAESGTWTSLRVIATEQPLGGDLMPTRSSSVGDVGVGRHRQSHDMNQRADPDGDDGVLELDVAPPVYASLLLRHMLLAQQRVEVGQTELRFTVPFDDVVSRFGTVSLRLVDGTGQPVAGARAQLATAQGGGQHASSDERGVCEIQRALPGLGVLSLHAAGLESYETHLTLRPGEALDLGEVVLFAPIELSGRVVSAAGEPIAATVWCAVLDRWRPPHPLTRLGGSTDFEGNFQLPRLGPRQYMFRATAGDDEAFVGFALVDARGGGGGRHEIVVRPSRRVTFRATAPLEVRVVVIEDPEGRPLDVVRQELRWPEAKVSLPDGDYVMTVYDGNGGRLLREPLRVAGADLARDLP